jgi:hypothetical protein
VPYRRGICAGFFPLLYTYIVVTDTRGEDQDYINQFNKNVDI